MLRITPLINFRFLHFYPFPSDSSFPQPVSIYACHARPVTFFYTKFGAQKLVDTFFHTLLVDCTLVFNYVNFTGKCVNYLNRII